MVFWANQCGCYRKPTGTSRKPALMTKNPSRVNNETQRGCIRIFSAALCDVQGNPSAGAWGSIQLFRFEEEKKMCVDDRTAYNMKICIVLEDMKKSCWWTLSGRGLGRAERKSMRRDFLLLSRRRPTSTICLPLTCTNNLIRPRFEKAFGA